MIYTKKKHKVSLSVKLLKKSNLTNKKQAVEAGVIYLNPDCPLLSLKS